MVATVHHDFKHRIPNEKVWKYSEKSISNQFVNNFCYIYGLHKVIWWNAWARDLFENNNLLV